jgi:hypothetical protein
VHADGRAPRRFSEYCESTYQCDRGRVSSEEIQIPRGFFLKSPLTVRVSFLVVLASLLALGSTPLHPVWEVRLADKLAEPAGWTAARGHPVLALVFSPDGSKLAATMDDHYAAGGFKTNLLVLDAQNPQGLFRQFDIETCGNFLAWAPEGNALLVCGTVARLDDGSSCDLFRSPLERAFGNGLNFIYWLATDRLIRSDRSTADLSCRPLGTWETQGKWAVAGTLPAKGWILLGQSVQRTIRVKTLPYNYYAIGDRDSHALTSGIFLADTYGDGSPIMTPGAEAVCITVSHPGQSKWTLGCRSLPKGSAIPIPKDLAEYVITQASNNSSVVVAERFGYHAWSLFREVPDYLNLLVVDVRSGHRLASLKPRMQPGNGATLSNIQNWYFQYALSPGGRFLAEGGNGDLRLFQLQ